MLKVAHLPPHPKAQSGCWNFLTTFPVRYQLAQLHIIPMSQLLGADSVRSCEVGLWSPFCSKLGHLFRIFRSPSYLGTMCFSLPFIPSNQLISAQIYSTEGNIKPSFKTDVFLWVEIVYSRSFHHHHEGDHHQGVFWWKPTDGLLSVWQKG